MSYLIFNKLITKCDKDEGSGCLVLSLEAKYQNLANDNEKLTKKIFSVKWISREVSYDRQTPCTRPQCIGTCGDNS